MKRFLLILLALVMLLTMFSCGKKDIEKQNEKDTRSVEDTADTPKDYYKTDVETNEVETPYGKLNYPVEWLDKVDITTAEEGDNFRVIFKAVYGDITVPLYDIVFGTSEIGFKLGDLPYDGGSVQVFCDDYTMEGTELVPEESLEDYYVMCDDLNVIISHLVYDHGMTVN